MTSNEKEDIRNGRSDTGKLHSVSDSAGSILVAD